MIMFHGLHRGYLQLFSLNFGTITIIQNVLQENWIQQFRPICLLNISFKFFTKIATNLIDLVDDHVISLTQSAFMVGQNILKGVVIFHEMIHELHRKKLKGGYLQDRF